MTVGAAARARIQAGGPTSKRRGALSVAGLKTLRELVFARENWRCGWCCSFEALELEHALNRSSRGSGDTWSETWGSCHGCNQLKLRDFGHGRLLVEPLGGGLFSGRFVIGSKRDYRVLQERVFGRAPTDEERAVLEGLA